MKESHYAIIGLHADLTNKMAASRYNSKGYMPICIDIPPADEKPLNSINRLEKHLEGIGKNNIDVAAIEANYAFRANNNCNQVYLNYIVDHINPLFLVLSSTTVGCLKDAKNWYDSKEFKSDKTKPQLIIIDTNISECFKPETEGIPRVSIVQVDDSSDNSSEGYRRGSEF